MLASNKPRLLVISQVYVPDPASVGQHMADVAETMVSRGFDVRVFTSARGYEDPQVKYPRHEFRNGVDVQRLPWSSFGKRSLAHRLLGQGLFLLQVLLRGLFTRRLTGILVSTSPPMASFAVLLISFVRRVPLVYWLMDLNPDQAIALQKVSPRNPLVEAIRWLNRRVFARAAAVIVLDRFMADRVQSQYRVRGRLEVLPPWPHEEALADVPRRSNPFVAQHRLTDRFVVMYSGNHSPASPVTTLLQAALRLRTDPRFLFVFIGGGLGKREVDEVIASERPTNIFSLPYQPLDQIKFSLSAADLHAVTLGPNMVGIIHPCKIYGAMAVGRPVLFVGPRPSHASDLIDSHQLGWQIDQGDVEALVAALLTAADAPPASLAAMGQRAKSAVKEKYGKQTLCRAFCDILETALLLSPRTAPLPPALANAGVPSNPPQSLRPQTARRIVAD